MTEARPAESSRMPLAIYLSAAIVTGIVVSWWAILLLSVELLLVATLLRLGRVPRRLPAWVAVIGVGRLIAVMAFAAVHDERFRWLASLAPTELGELVTPQLALAGLHELAAGISLRAWVAAVLALLVAAWSTLRSRERWYAPVAAAGIVPLLLLVDRPLREEAAPALSPPAALASAIGLYSLELPATATVTAIPPRRLPSEARYDEVLLVVLESVGAPNLGDHLARHPEGAFARLWESGLRLQKVIAASNVSHMAQPSLLTSQEFTRGVGRHLYVLPSARAGWSFPAHFAAKGWLTFFESSQDETWLGMSTITLEQPWTHARHALDLPPEAVYADACGTRKALDSGTLVRIETLLESARGPRFAYVNLQNTHFPFIAEEALDQEIAEVGFYCREFLDLPPEKLDVVRRRYELALDATLNRVADFARRHPEALVIVTGDHPEHLVAGPGFGHSKTAIAEETDSFALLLGPDIPSRSISSTISALDLLPTVVGLVNPRDLEVLPMGLLQGVDVLRELGEGVAFTTSYGLGAPQYAAVGSEARLEVAWEGRVCRGTELRCEALAEALSFWVSCKTAFHSTPRPLDVFDSCTRVARGSVVNDTDLVDGSLGRESAAATGEGRPAIEPTELTRAGQVTRPRSRAVVRSPPR